MFDIGWSEFALIAVVALVAIGPKELPGVLRMLGQWIRKARKMAGEFQGQFQEAMREAEMADLKQSFDEVREAASGFTKGGLMTSLQRDVSNALRIDDIEKPASKSAEIFGAELPAAAPAPKITAAPTPEASEPLAIVSDAQVADQPTEASPSESAPAPEEVRDGHELRDAKAS